MPHKLLLVAILVLGFAAPADAGAKKDDASTKSTAAAVKKADKKVVVKGDGRRMK